MGLGLKGLGVRDFQGLGTFGVGGSHKPDSCTWGVLGCIQSRDKLFYRA